MSKVKSKDTRITFVFLVSFLQNLDNYLPTAQQTFTWSNSTIETLEKGVKICSKLTIKTPQ